MREIWVMEWVESEAGMGQRPDGFSLHRSKAAFEAYEKAYWMGMPKGVPYAYEKPCWSHPVIQWVDDAVADWVEKEDRRLGRGSGKVSGGIFLISNPLALSDIEASAIGKAVGPIHSAAKKQTL